MLNSISKREAGTDSVSSWIFHKCMDDWFRNVEPPEELPIIAYLEMGIPQYKASDVSAADSDGIALLVVSS